MRRVQLAAGAIGVGLLVAALLGGRALAAQIGLGATFPATRIQVDPAPSTVNLPGPTTVTALVEDWHGATIAKVPVAFAILSGPNKGKSMPSAATNSDGRATLTYSNNGEPGIDVIQASFSDGLEVHKSNRHFVLWLSGPPATAIRSPATISATPNCFQPAAAARTASDTFRAVAPRTTPKPSASTSAPSAETTTITVSGDNFNPFSPVLITFDAGPGGQPQNFEARTDPFGHFNRDIQVTEPAEGLHLIRADDFRQREADDTNYQLPCFQPSVALDPPIGPPGFVTTAVGSGFPANSAIAVINWQAPALLSPLPLNINTDASGSFQVPILILYHDLLGPRMLQAIVPNPFGDRAGAAIEADAPFLVTPGRSQPSDFALRR